MKIVLCYAPSEQQFIPVPPLGIAVLKTYLINCGIQVETLDLELELWLSQNGKSSKLVAMEDPSNSINELDLTLIISKLMCYDTICFSLMGIRQLIYTKRIISLVRQKRKIRVFLGGSFVTKQNYLGVQKFADADSCIYGEGWSELYKAITGQQFDDALSPHINSEHFDIPIADYSDINREGYVLQQKELYKIDYGSLNYHILVGDKCCPYNCSFCRISKNTDKMKESRKIAEEMILLNKKYGCTNFSLICNEMNPNKRFLLDFAETLLNSGYKFHWFCYLRPNNLNAEDFILLRKAGCVLIRYGVESGSQKILDSMNKKLYVHEMEQILEDAHNAGIWNHINIMSGYLYETDEDVFKTIEFIKRNKEYIDSIRINPLFIPINSPIYNNPEKYGIEIIENTGSCVKFNQKDKLWECKKNEIIRTNTLLLDLCKSSDINFAGILPNLVSTALAFFGDINKTKAWLKEKHGYLWDPISPDTAKMRLAHPELKDVSINEWDKISGERGLNYLTLV